MSSKKFTKTISERQTKEKAAVLEHLKKIPIVQIACEKSGVGRASYYRWRNEDADFKKAADEAMAEGVLFINDMSEAQVISLIRDKNWQAIRFWLLSHHPSYKTKVDFSGHITYSDDEELTPEQAALVREAMRLASFEKNTDDEKNHKTNELRENSRGDAER